MQEEEVLQNVMSNSVLVKKCHGMLLRFSMKVPTRHCSGDALKKSVAPFL
jgi:hypothetical protein